MSDRDQLVKSFWEHRAKLDEAGAARWHPSHLPLDVDLLGRLCQPGQRVLDLGCGRCDLANWLVLERGAIVHAVDAQPEFLAHAVRHPDLTVEIGDVRTYQLRGPFDGVLLFGVITSVIDPAVRSQLYARVADGLAPDGFFLVKSQFGIEGDVEVDTTSETLGHRYYAIYPDLDSEVARLAAHFHVDVLDVYPRELSPHANTRFRHLLCRSTRRKGL